MKELSTELNDALKLLCENALSSKAAKGSNFDQEKYRFLHWLVRTHDRYEVEHLIRNDRDEILRRILDRKELIAAIEVVKTRARFPLWQTPKGFSGEFNSPEWYSDDLLNIVAVGPSNPIRGGLDHMESSLERVKNFRETLVKIEETAIEDLDNLTVDLNKRSHSARDSLVETILQYWINRVGTSWSKLAISNENSAHRFVYLVADPIVRDVEDNTGYSTDTYLRTMRKLKQDLGPSEDLFDE